MRKGTNKERDKELIARLKEEAPEMQEARVDFDSVIDKLVASDESPKAQLIKSKKRHKKA